mmetsp:Transcript_2257/g.8708  ORF Transcript_2257/g.8708 Transcript_2257/m.8708 type:complete len:213 (+) Transcript_2257:1039-1677(+)
MPAPSWGTLGHHLRPLALAALATTTMTTTMTTTSQRFPAAVLPRAAGATPCAATGALPAGQGTAAPTCLAEGLRDLSPACRRPRRTSRARPLPAVAMRLKAATPPRLETCRRARRLARTQTSRRRSRRFWRQRLASGSTFAAPRFPSGRGRCSRTSPAWRRCGAARSRAQSGTFACRAGGCRAPSPRRRTTTLMPSSGTTTACAGTSSRPLP